MRVLITRPAGDAEALAEAVRERGHEPVLQPLTEIIYELPEPPPERPAATIFTSRNAARGLVGVDWAAALRDLPAYCVGAATARAARDGGFRHAVTGGGTGAQLARRIADTRNPDDGPLLYLTGDHLAFDMQAALGAHGFTVWRRIVYRGVLAANLDPGIVRELREEAIDAAILMSPRAAAHFAELARNAELEAQAARLRYYCLSEAIARALAPLGASRTWIAPDLTRRALLDMLGPPSSA